MKRLTIVLCVAVISACNTGDRSLGVGMTAPVIRSESQRFFVGPAALREAISVFEILAADVKRRDRVVIATADGRHPSVEDYLRELRFDLAVAEGRAASFDEQFDGGRVGGSSTIYTTGTGGNPASPPYERDVTFMSVTSCNQFPSNTTSRFEADNKLYYGNFLLWSDRHTMESPNSIVFGDQTVAYSGDWGTGTISAKHICNPGAGTTYYKYSNAGARV